MVLSVILILFIEFRMFLLESELIGSWFRSKTWVFDNNLTSSVSNLFRLLYWTCFLYFTSKCHLVRNWTINIVVGLFCIFWSWMLTCSFNFLLWSFFDWKWFWFSWLWFTWWNIFYWLFWNIISKFWWYFLWIINRLYITTYFTFIYRIIIKRPLVYNFIFDLSLLLMITFSVGFDGTSSSDSLSRSYSKIWLHQFLSFKVDRFCIKPGSSWG